MEKRWDGWKSYFSFRKEKKDKEVVKSSEAREGDRWTGVEEFLENVDKAFNESDAAQDPGQRRMIDYIGYTGVSVVGVCAFMISFSRGYSKGLAMDADDIERELGKKITKSQFDLLMKKAKIDRDAHRLAMRALAGGSALSLLGTAPLGFLLWKYSQSRRKVSAVESKPYVNLRFSANESRREKERQTDREGGGGGDFAPYFEVQTKTQNPY